MPIKPQFVEKILLGEKKYEFRKRRIADTLSYIIIYASSPIKRIVGIGEVDNVFLSTPQATWRRARHAAGINKKDYDNYFKGHNQAWTIEMKKIIRLEQPLKPKDIMEDFNIPQSFMYVTNAYLHTILEKGLSLDGKNF